VSSQLGELGFAATRHRYFPAPPRARQTRHVRRTIRLKEPAAWPYAEGMPLLVVHVHVHVKPECVGAFKTATLANAQASVREPGIARFDVMQQADDPSRFVLIEAYRTPAAPAAHKETSHYATWRDTVAPMMASPRTSVKFSNVFPADDAW
jgi:(4S)-4-hydroxy-5-phosphonooxypentane-2,3-dione isomerase